MYFYNNTVINRVDQMLPGQSLSSRWGTNLLLLDDINQKVDVRNNIFYNEAVTAGQNRSILTITNFSDSVDFSGPNWLGQPYALMNSNGCNPCDSKVTGLQNLISNPANNPGFVDPVHHDFRLAAGSANVDTAGPLAAAAASSPVDMQYLLHQAGTPRPVLGAAMDLGAWESEGLPALPVSVTRIALNTNTWRNYPGTTVQLTAAVAPVLAALTIQRP